MSETEILDLINERPKSEHVCDRCGRPLEDEANDLETCWEREGELQ